MFSDEIKVETKKKTISQVGDEVVIKDIEGVRFYKERKLHRLDGPAVTIILDDWVKCFIKKRRSEWWTKGKRHRSSDQPAVEEKGFDVVVRAEWWENNYLTRGDDKPAIVTPQECCWVMNGEPHRDYGLPAKKSPTSESWFIVGKPVSKQEAFGWAINLRKLKIGLFLLFTQKYDGFLMSLIKQTWKKLK